MRLATRDNGTPDGELVLISSDGERCLAAGDACPNLLSAFADWTLAEPVLRKAAEKVEQGEGTPIDPQTQFCAPMPRTWQWLDGSVFSTHAKLMEVAFGTDPIDTKRPLMYQGQSDRFYGPTQDIPFRSEADGIDFEGEFGVILDHVPMGCTAAQAMERIRLVVQINDWSLRAHAVPEMKTGFGFILAKPPCSLAPFAVTPDELGENWRDGRVCLDLQIAWNGNQFGSANGSEMDIGFHELVAHAATTRDLVAGTIIGSGTVANASYAKVGSSCISERRAIEIIADGKPATGFMEFGDSVCMAGVDGTGRMPFGTINQKVVRLS